MLRGEGNAGERRKTTIGLISKKATLHVQHTFFLHFFAVFLHDYNVKLPETSLWQVFWRKCRTCSRSLFLTAARFHLALVATSIPPYITAATKFSCCSSDKKCLLCFFSRWASLACRLLSFLLCLSLALYSKFVDMLINLLSLIL